MLIKICQFLFINNKFSQLATITKCDGTDLVKAVSACNVVQGNAHVSLAGLINSAVYLRYPFPFSFSVFTECTLRRRRRRRPRLGHLSPGHDLRP